MPNKKKHRRGNWVGCQRLAGLAAVAVALGCQRLAGLAVELAVELAVALGARSLVVGVVVKTLQNRHRFFWLSVDSVDAVANVRRNHFHCLILRQRLESTPLVLQLRQRLDARLLKSPSMKRYTTCTYTTYTSPPPPHQDVLQLCQRLDAVGCLSWCPWLDQLCGCLSRQQLRQRLEHFFCCLSQ